jgi:hypothetical protein
MNNAAISGVGSDGRYDVSSTMGMSGFPHGTEENACEAASILGARTNMVCGIVAVLPTTITRRDLQAHTKIFEFGMDMDTATRRQDLGLMCPPVARYG